MNTIDQRKINNMENALLYITEKFNKIYSTQNIGNRKCFINNNSVLFNVDMLKSDGAFVVEYANNITEAKHNMFEDGDLFFLEDYNSLDNLIEAMCTEINNEQVEQHW
ncbi:MAG: hypothetical protein LUG60_06005 [Erysipelotrichaceae bacterium]|nr:hypothetical protein [Erysipelotrichaceae bacterium]